MQQNDQTFGRVTVLVGERNGKYPHGNSLRIAGTHATAFVDPSLSVVARAEELAGQADLVLLSHVHEDHVAGVPLFPRAQVHAHRADAPGMRSMAGLQAIYGYGALGDTMAELVRSAFHYAERPDTHDFEDGAVFDLGGTRIRCLHMPGHTRGHCALLIEPEGLLFLGDIDLSGFGPYYGDAWSDLEDFERTLERIRQVEASIWVSFHHVGVLQERQAFLDRLDRFAAKLAERERNLLEFLDRPHTLAEMVQRRFLYPAHAQAVYIDAVEERTIRQHLDRLVGRGDVVCVGDLYRKN